MNKFIDRTGKRYGRLLVIRNVGRIGAKTLCWECLCDCGNRCFLSSHQFGPKGKNSCGCMKREYHCHLSSTHRATNPQQPQINAILRRYKQGAKDRSLPFELTYQEWYGLTQQTCHYCGVPPSNISKTDKERNYHSKPFLYNGIDRIDSTKGYTVENCVPCCKMCNFAKKDLPQDIFLSWLERAYKHTYENRPI